MYRKWPKFIQRSKTKYFRYLPGPLKRRMLKKSVQVPTSYPEGLVFKLAETKDEFEQAFALLQQNYQETGLVDEKQYSLRVTKYHTLPTTHVLIAKMNDEVVGTVSLIEDGAFGLPIDHFASVDDLRKQGRRLVEVSSLAVKRGTGLRRGKLFIPLTIFLFQVAHKCLRVDSLVAVTRTQAGWFYTDILGFDTIRSGGAEQYKFVNAAPNSSAFHLDVKNDQGFKHVASYNLEMALTYFREDMTGQVFQVPKNEFWVGAPTSFNPDWVGEMAGQRSTAASSMTEDEKIRLASILASDDLVDSLKIERERLATLKMRQTQRYSATNDGHLVFESGMTSKARIIDISESGILLSAESIPLVSTDGQVELTMDVSDQKAVKLKLQIKWIQSENNRLGLQILDAWPKRLWNDYYLCLKRTKEHYSRVSDTDSSKSSAA